MKEALYQKSGDTDVSLTGSANLDVHRTLIGLRAAEVRGLTTLILTVLPTVKVCWFLRLLDVNIPFEIK